MDSKTLQERVAFAKKSKEDKEMTEKLCGDEECCIEQCPDEMCHCEYGLQILQQRAELRAELTRDEREGL